jgi:hypothetical protein
MKDFAELLYQTPKISFIWAMKISEQLIYTLA